MEETAGPGDVLMYLHKKSSMCVNNLKQVVPCAHTNFNLPPIISSPTTVYGRCNELENAVNNYRRSRGRKTLQCDSGIRKYCDHCRHLDSYHPSGATVSAALRAWRNFPIHQRQMESDADGIGCHINGKSAQC